MEMTVADILDPSQVEIEDYVKFYADGAMRSGPVLNVQDNGDTITITLSDDIEGDSIDYEVNMDTKVFLLVHEAVAV